MVKERHNPIFVGQEIVSGCKHLILYNDDVNTFDFVIETLMDVCDHDPLQAEQCALIAHFSGKCPVKSGADFELKPIYLEMTNRKLTVSIS